MLHSNGRISFISPAKCCLRTWEVPTTNSCVNLLLIVFEVNVRHGSVRPPCHTASKEPFLRKFEIKVTFVWIIQSFLELLLNALHLSRGPSIEVGTYCLSDTFDILSKQRNLPISVYHFMVFDCMTNNHQLSLCHESTTLRKIRMHFQSTAFHLAIQIQYKDSLDLPTWALDFQLQNIYHQSNFSCIVVHHSYLPLIAIEVRFANQYTSYDWTAINS